MRSLARRWLLSKVKGQEPMISVIHPSPAGRIRLGMTKGAGALGLRSTSSIRENGSFSTMENWRILSPRISHMLVSRIRPWMSRAAQRWREVTQSAVTGAWF
jgi:hypothetical protein